MTWINYQYKGDDILPNHSKVPDIPTINLLIVGRDLKKGIVGETIVGMGFEFGGSVTKVSIPSNTRQT